MIAHELHFKIDDNDRYRKFLSPAVREYEKSNCLRTGGKQERIP